MEAFESAFGFAGSPGFSGPSESSSAPGRGLSTSGGRPGGWQAKFLKFSDALDNKIYERIMKVSFSALWFSTNQNRLDQTYRIILYYIDI